jgi:photosystem II stability/assembly factor-like uncharacterized protein
VDPNRTRPTAAIAAALLLGLFTVASIQPAVEARTPRGEREVGAASAKLPASARRPDPEATKRVRAAYSAMPLRFEPATGANAEFIARGAGYALDLARGEARLAIGGMKDGPPAAVTMRLFGASASATGEGRRVLPGITNYLIGNDRREWRNGVRSYAEVAYRRVYPGIDLVYYGNQRQLEFDFIVSPGASHRTIALAFDGSKRLSIDRTGDLLIETAAGTLVQHAPVIYQDKSGMRRTVRGGYVLRRDGRVGFDVHAYDRNLPLIIDPVLTYATYLGGSREERAEGLAFDAQGNMYVAGLTGAANFPASGSPGTSHGRDEWDVFVLKLNAAGDQFLYATYIGGSGYEEPAALAVDADGNAYVVGQTQSADFPTFSGLQSSRHGIDDAFVTKLDATGAIVYSTYLGGNGEDIGSGIAVDALGRAYVAGYSISADFPTVNALQPSLGGYPAFKTLDGGRAWDGIGGGLRASWVQAFAIDPNNTQIVYAASRYDGVFKSSDAGTTWTATSADLPSYAVNGMVVDSSGVVFVGNDAGIVRSRDGGASWTMLPLSMPVSALAIDPGSNVLYAGAPAWYPTGVFMSGDGGDTWRDTNLRQDVTSLAVSHSVVYAGTSNGVFKSVGTGSWVPASGGIQEAVTSLAVSSASPDFAYAGTNTALFITADGGNTWSARLPFPVISVTIAPSNPSVAYVATWNGSGMTMDGGMLWLGTGPAGITLGVFAIDPLDPRRVYGGGSVGWDSFVSRISADGSHLEYSTFIGGASSEWGTDISVDSSGSAYLAGITQSTDFPVRNALQPNAGGLMDIFVAKISETGALAYSTYLGGGASDYAPKIAVDGSGRAHVVGITLSPNFPTANAFQPAHGGGFYDVFVTALSAAGSSLVYSTYLGGNDQDGSWQSSGGPAVAVGPSGDVFVTGATTSNNFPTRDAVQTSHGGGNSDAFIANFDAAGQLVYSTYFGGTGADYGTRVAVDPAGNVAVAGGTTSPDLWTRHAVQASKDGAEDVFVARIGPGSPAPDTTTPTTTINLFGAPAPSGWWRSAVNVTLRGVDDEDGTGIAFVEYSLNGGAWQRYTGTFLVAAQGTTVVRARATDRAGNTESPGASSTFTIDWIEPAISINSPSAVEYLHAGSLLMSFGATDSLSGLASVTGTVDGVAVTNGQPMPLLTLTLGFHTLFVSASDQAGNTSSTTVTFRIVATIDTLIGAVNTFVATGQIDASGRNLLTKLEDAKQLLARGKVTAARNKLTDFKNQVSTQSGQSISPSAAQLLIADADYVIGTLGPR